MKTSPALIFVSVLALAIVILLAQNLGTVIQISFLGFTTLPLPLSLAMLFAFLSGGISAALWNQLAFWLNDRLPENTDDNKETTKEQEIKDDDREEAAEEYYDDEEEYYDDDEEDDIIEIEYIDR